MSLSSCHWLVKVTSDACDGRLKVTKAVLFSIFVHLFVRSSISHVSLVLGRSFI